MAILGASAGLGAALASHHYRQGDAVLAVARRRARLAQLATAVGAASDDRWRQAVLDLTEPADLDTLVGELERCAPLRAVYFVAAANEVTRGGPPSVRLQVIERYHRLLFVSWVAVAEAADEAGLIGAGGAFVAISSIAAGVPFAGLDLYGAGKAALEAWARTARETSAVRHVVVRPGRFPSDFFEPSEFDYDRLPHALAARIANDVARGRHEIHLGDRRDRLASLLGNAAQRISSYYVKDASPERSD